MQYKFRKNVALTNDISKYVEMFAQEIPINFSDHEI